jgi:hypothetical protein
MKRSLLAMTLLLCGRLTQAADRYDVVIYGGTSGGVIAAVEVARQGKSVVLIEPFQHVGGLTISGLGWTDTGDKRVIGGLSREFYQRLKKHYDNPAAWPNDDREKFSHYKKDEDAIWVFEPHVAEAVFEELLKEAKIPVIRGERIDRTKGREGLTKEGARITSIRMESGREFTGRVFIDATYEGDLMALAGVSYTVGREANSQYGETLNGIQKAKAREHQFVKPVDPYVRAGDKSSGLLPGINTSPGEDGAADRRVQTYNYRICMTDFPENRIPFQKPAGYDPIQQELLLRNFEAGDLRIPLSIPGLLPNRKTDLNNNYAVSTDWIGMNHDYPEASYQERKRILDAHETYVRGFLWALQNDPRVPEKVRNDVAKWGYAKDEFSDNNNWPYWAYIREARRMVGEYVQTEMDCRRIVKCDDSVGLGSYNMDSHHCQRYVDETGHVRNEGDIQVSPGGPYLISYRALVPKKSECTNLFVPVCLSATHAAYGSIRMEPVFMVLGHSSAAAACLAIDRDVDVQGVDYAKLREKLLAEKQVLDLPRDTAGPKVTIDASSLPGIVLDESHAKLTGTWAKSSSAGKFVGEQYLHDGKAGGGAAARFVLPIKTAGFYELRVSYSAHANRATNATVRVVQGGAKALQFDKSVQIDQTKPPAIDGLFHSLGSFFLANECAVEIANDNADGYVIVDAVQAIQASRLPPKR